jgi:hypothetical protein
MLEEKLETLTKEVVALRQAIEKNGLGGAAKAKAPAADEADEAPAKKPAAKKPAAKKKVEPEHDADEVGAIMRKLAKEGDAEKKAVRKFIAGKDCADLADLLTKPELFDETYAWAEEQLGGDDDAEEDDDDDV